MNSEIVVCECGSTEHQMVFIYCKGKDENEFDWMDIKIHLSSQKGFISRIAAAIKYIFGYRSRYGNWDTFEINEDNCDQIIRHLYRMKTNHRKIRDFHEKKRLEMEHFQNKLRGVQNSPNDGV